MVVIPAVVDDSLWVDPSVVTDTSVVVVAPSALVTPKKAFNPVHEVLANFKINVSVNV